MSFSTCLSKLLADSNLSQIDLAKRTKLTQAAVSQLLSGVRQPSLASLLRICDGLKVTPNDLLGYNASSVLVADCVAYRETLRSMRDLANEQLHGRR